MGGDSFRGAGAAGRLGTLIGLLEKGAGPRDGRCNPVASSGGAALSAQGRAGPEVGRGGGGLRAEPG